MYLEINTSVVHCIQTCLVSNWNGILIHAKIFISYHRRSVLIVKLDKKITSINLSII